LHGVVFDILVGSEHRAGRHVIPGGLTPPVRDCLTALLQAIKPAHENRL
jgi:hypothetical protein